MFLQAASAVAAIGGECARITDTLRAVPLLQVPIDSCLGN